MSTATIVLAAAGGFFELTGLGLVVVQIRSDRELASRYIERIEQAGPVGIHAPAMRPDMQFMHDYELSRGSPAEQVAKLRAQYGQDMRRVTDAASRAVYEERHRFASFANDLLQGGLGQRKLGAVLLALGILCGTAANITSA